MSGAQSNTPLPPPNSNSLSSSINAAHDLCEKRLSTCVKKNFDVRRLVYALEELGCKIPKDFYSCTPCANSNISGGFVAFTGEKDYKPSVVVCEDINLPFKDTFENTIVHELVHAYDFCRAKIDTNNCLQHACTEIRASNLSGECGFGPELLRGNTTLQFGHRDCVMRRAELSVSMNPSCKNIAKEAVQEVFTKCYADRKPLILNIESMD